MKVFYASALIAVLINGSTAFAPAPVSQQTLTSTTSLSMGLFDMFLSDEEKQKKKERELREIEEQEELQRQILERRRNPEAMEEYEARVSVRRKMYMAGRDDLAKDFEVMKDVPTSD